MNRLLTVLCILSVLCGSSRADDGPNIVLILADDPGQRDLGCYGSTFHRTPDIDSLARRGMKFENGYSASPLCSPTRASLLTGLHPARIGISFAPALRGEAFARDTIFCHFPHGGRSDIDGFRPATWVRRGDWKLIRFFAGNDDGSDKLELYNLRDDISETKNFAATNLNVAAELNSLITGFLKETAAVVPVRNPDFGKTATTPALANARPPRRTSSPRAADFQKLICAGTTAFWDAYLKGKPEAQKWPFNDKSNAQVRSESDPVVC